MLVIRRLIAHNGNKERAREKQTMTFDLHIQIDDQSPEGLALENFAAQAGSENFDHIFTPDLIAKLQAAEDEARTGNNITIEQVTAHFEMKRQAWHANQHA